MMKRKDPLFHKKKKKSMKQPSVILQKEVKQRIKKKIQQLIKPQHLAVQNRYG